MMLMRHSLKTGISFGLTSGVITTLGLMVGLHAGTHSKLVVIGGILTIAVADAFSDALGIHISQEAENKHTAGEVWQATAATFASKFIFALTFLIPVLLFELDTAIIVSVVWGLLALGLLSLKLAVEQNEKPIKVIGEHLLVAILVIVLTNYFGGLISSTFG
jgi:VIT1/CCC1 family predicted Fe2+/Mn2+ transporter